MTSVKVINRAAQAVQKQIDDIQEELHSSIQKVVVEANTNKNVHYAKRHEVISKAIKDGELPSSFWADSIIAAFASPEEVKSDERAGLLGPYDAQLLRDYLTDFQVKYTERGVKVTLVFKTNPFFEETELWAEAVQDLVESDENDEDDGEDADGCRFSGVTWKPGHGPTENDEAEDDHNNNNNNNNGNDDKNNANGNGRKRERPAASSTSGWSFLEAFSKMPPHPEDDDEFDDGDDDDVLAEAAEQWEAEMDDRRDLLQLLVDDVWADPVAAAQLAKATEEKTDEPAKQRNKAE